MQRLDLHVFEIMDYSEGNRLWGTVDLPKFVVDDYYEGMPNAIGFINGYGPASTFDLREGRPLLSYDYYLSPDRPKESVLADLQELARLNPERPYFLLLIGTGEDSALTQNDPEGHAPRNVPRREASTVFHATSIPRNVHSASGPSSLTDRSGSSPSLSSR